MNGKTKPTNGRPMWLVVPCALGGLAVCLALIWFVSSRWNSTTTPNQENVSTNTTETNTTETNTTETNTTETSTVETSTAETSTAEVDTIDPVRQPWVGTWRYTYENETQYIAFDATGHVSFCGTSLDPQEVTPDLIEGKIVYSIDTTDGGSFLRITSSGVTDMAQAEYRIQDVADDKATLIRVDGGQSVPVEFSRISEEPASVIDEQVSTAKGG